jgi:hypothetical protein
LRWRASTAGLAVERGELVLRVNVLVRVVVSAAAGLIQYRLVAGSGSNHASHPMTT